MKIYLTSNIPVGTFDPVSFVGLKDSKDPPADFLIEDIIQLFQYDGTAAVNTKEIALAKKDAKKAKYIYSIEINEIE